MVGVVTAGEVTTMDGGEVEATITDGGAIAIGDSARLSRTNDRRVCVASQRHCRRKQAPVTWDFGRTDPNWISISRVTGPAQMLVD
jgi:hypothetical protein